MYLDDFDLCLANYVENGILDEVEIISEADKQEAKFKQHDQTSSFESAFRLLHDSFAENQKEVCDAIMNGFTENLNVVSLKELSQVAEIFDRIGEPGRAENVISYAEENAPKSFWLQEDPFNRPIYGERLKAIVAKRHVDAMLEPDFEVDLIAAAQTYNADTTLVLLLILPVISWVCSILNPAPICVNLCCPHLSIER
jgi:hypothetical protein